MGLLDMFNTDEGRFGLSLLAAAAPTTQPMGFGQRLAGAMQLQDQWKQSQADRQLQQQEAEWLRTQRDRKAKTWAMEDQAAQAQAAKRAAIPSLFSQDGSGGLSGFNVARALELGLGPEEIDKWSKIPNAGRAKVARTIEGRDEQGRPVTYQVDEFGQRVGDALEQWKAPMLINQGDRQTLLDPGTRQTLGSLSMNMSQAERDASARGWASNALARERLAFDMNGGAEAGKPQYKDGQWVMPPRNMQPGQAIPAMPSTAAKEANEALALIRQAEQIIPKATGSYLGSATDTRAAGGAITGAATAGLVNPEEALVGGAIGAGMPVGVRAMGAVGSAVGRQFRPGGDSSQLARRAMDMGAPLGIADIAEGKFTKAVRSILNDAPLTGGIGATQNEAKQRWFNRAVGEVFVAADDKLTPQVMDAAKKKLGSEFDRIWNNNALVVDDKLMQSLSQTRARATMLPKAERSRVLGMLDDFEGQITQAPDGSIVVPGDVANRYQSSIRKASESAQGFLKEDLAGLRKNILGAFNRSVSAEDAAALALNQKKYKAFKTVEPLLAKGEVGIAGREAGDVPAALLPGAVFNSYRANTSGAPLAELAKIGSKYLVDRTPQTGGSTRALIQNSAIVGALGAGMFTNPLLAAPVIPAGMALNRALGSPALARGLLGMSAPEMGGLLSLGQKAAPVLIAQ